MNLMEIQEIKNTLCGQLLTDVRFEHGRFWVRQVPACGWLRSVENALADRGYELIYWSLRDGETMLNVGKLNIFS